MAGSPWWDMSPEVDCQLCGRVHRTPRSAAGTMRNVLTQVGIKYVDICAFFSQTTCTLVRFICKQLSLLHFTCNNEWLLQDPRRRRRRWSWAAVWPSCSSPSSPVSFTWSIGRRDCRKRQTCLGGSTPPTSVWGGLDLELRSHLLNATTTTIQKENLSAW